MKTIKTLSKQIEIDIICANRQNFDSMVPIFERLLELKNLNNSIFMEIFILFESGVFSLNRENLDVLIEKNKNNEKDISISLLDALNKITNNGDISSVHKIMCFSPSRYNNLEKILIQDYINEKWEDRLSRPSLEVVDLDNFEAWSVQKMQSYLQHALPKTDKKPKAHRV